MKKKKNGGKSLVDIFLKERKDWNGVNPVTKVIPDKRKKKPKYRYDED